MSQRLHLLKSKFFLPLFICQLLACFGDNFVRTAFVTFITYHYSSFGMVPPSILVTLAIGLFILPSCLISATGGQLGDVYDKAKVIRWARFANMFMVFIGVLGFFSYNYTMLLTSLFLLGIQASIFGAIKYSILPEHLHDDELMFGNALIESSTFFAILFGIIAGGLVVTGNDFNVAYTCVVAATVAVLSYLASLFIPATKRRDKTLSIDLNIFRATYQCVQYARTQSEAFLAILGVAWFWLIGSVFISLIPALTKEVLYGDESVFIMVLSIFSIGVGAGSVLVSKILRDSRNINFVPTAILLLSFALLDLWWNTSVPIEPRRLEGIHYFLSQPRSLWVCLDFLLLGTFGGLYVVPLYTFLQVKAKQSHRGRMIAATNILSAIFVVCSSILSMALLYIGLKVSQLLCILAFANVFTTAYICRIIPEAVARNFLKVIVRMLCRFEIVGMENYYKAGKRVMIIANHASFLDPVLIGAFIPDRLVFAIDYYIAKSWWLRPFLGFLRALPIDPGNPMATKTLIDKLRSDQPVVIFPEGRLTVTGSLMKIFEGPGLIAEKTGAMLLPIRLEGVEYSLFSRMHGKLRLHIFPRIKMTILPPRKLTITPEEEKASSRERRHIIGDKLYEIMSEMMFNGAENKLTLFESLVAARRQFGGRHVIAADVNKVELSYNKLIAASIILGYQIKKDTIFGEKVGVLLPNTAGTLVTIFAMIAYGRVPAMLNYATGYANIIACCKAVQLRIVYTSRIFVEKGELHDMVKVLENAGVKVMYLEDVRARVTIINKLKGMWHACRPVRWYRRYMIQKTPNHDVNSNSLAIVLFTSGSEGVPKGVALSHNNIIANLQQVASRIDFTYKDRVFNALPMFHSFGLTGGTFLPLFSGVFIFFYPSPLHYRIIPDMIYFSNTTIFFGTDTFLSGYAKYAHPYDFFSLRYVFAGAEKLQESTRKLWMEKFGIRVLEGYGTTETSPVVAVNTMMYNKAGTVGRFLPNMQYKILPVKGIKSGGQLAVAGPNIMLGYIRQENPGIIEQPSITVDGKVLEGWYDTGDIVDIDPDKYLVIVGRAKRFAKIGGEMISLAVVEELAAQLWPDYLNAVLHVPDPRKGEAIILFTDNPTAQREDMMAFVKQHGYNELLLPQQIRYVEAIPTLATGKVDYMALKALLELEEAQ